MPLSCPLVGTYPTTQACALTRNQTSNILVCGTMSIPLSPYVFSFDSNVQNKRQNCHSLEHFLNLLRFCFLAIVASLAQINSYETFSLAGSSFVKRIENYFSSDGEGFFLSLGSFTLTVGTARLSSKTPCTMMLYRYIKSSFSGHRVWLVAVAERGFSVKPWSKTMN